MGRRKRNGTPRGEGWIKRLARSAFAWARVALASLVALTLSGVALGQEDAQQKAAAEMLFSEGQELLFNRKYAEACLRFEQSQAIDPGVGTLLYLGECYERLGRLASAWAIYREAGSAAREAGQLERSRTAYARANKLTRSIPKLVVSVAAENRIEGFLLAIDEKPLSSALFGIPFHIDPGRHELIAQAPGRAPWSSKVEIEAGGEANSIQVPALQPTSRGELSDAQGAGSLQPAARRDATLAALAGGVAPSGAVRADRVEHSPRQTTGIIIAGAGAAALGAGVLFGLNAKSKDDDAKADCPDGCLTRAAADLNQEARNWAWAANGAYFVGGLALAAGGILYFMPERTALASARRLPLDISVASKPGGGMLVVGGEL